MITTREKVAEIEKYEATSKQIDLEQISAQAGRALLRVGGVKGTDAELEATTQDFGKHALAINLLAAYLQDIPGHHISNAKQIKDLKKVPVKKGKHPRRIIAAFAERFGKGPEQQLLNILGLFDRPAPLEGIEAVKAAPAISGLTDHLVDLAEAKWLKTIENLRNVKLIVPESKHDKDTLDCHPLVREHFGERLQRTIKEAWREAHSRLYDYYKSLPEKLYGKKLPETLAEMEPLFAAVAHGCLAGRHQEALEDVYVAKILRGNEHYSWKRLGSFGSDLSIISGFFSSLWKQPVFEITDYYKAFVLGQAGLYLKALGRLMEATQPMETTVGLFKKQKEWQNAAIAAGNLSELFLTLGQVQQAVDSARQSVDFADRSGEDFWRTVTRCQRADAFHKGGELDEAEKLFSEGEAIQRQSDTAYRYMYSSPGFQFCDLLLSRGQVREVVERAGQTLEIAKKSLGRGLGLHDIGNDYLTLGRAHFLQTVVEGSKDYSKAEHYLNQAVAGLREAGQQAFLQNGFLARVELYRAQENFVAAWEDLSEAQEIAERGEMGLHLADFHLEACRLHLAQHKARDTFTPESVGAETISPRPKNHLEAAKGHLKTAKGMINKMGYHRRDPEVEELQLQIANYK